MAYSDFIKHYVNSNQQFVDDFYNWIENVLGWTVWDDQKDNGYKVYTTTGEDGKRVSGYIRIFCSTSSLGVILYRYWDATNHNGIGAVGTAHYNWGLSSDFRIYAYGNKDFIALAYVSGSTKHAFIVGMPEHGFLDLRTKLTADASGTGDNIQITVEDTTGFEAGQKYRIYDPSNGHIDTVQVASVDDATHLTIANLPFAYTNGSYIGLYTTRAIVYQDVNYNGVQALDYYQVSGTNNNYTQSVNFPYNSVPQGINQNPFWILGAYVSTPIIAFSNSYNGYHAWVGWFETYLRGTSSSIAVEDLLYVNKLEEGTSTGDNGTNTLKDTTKSWGTDEFKDKYVIITNGDGKGEVHKITTNDATSLTIAENWEVLPDNTTTYIIVDEIWRGIVSYSPVSFIAKEVRSGNP